MIDIAGKKYLTIQDYNTIIDVEVLALKCTDYFYKFDYIVGDISYGNLRLKGFYNSDNLLVQKHNDIDKLNDYISLKCSYGCSYFIIKRL